MSDTVDARANGGTEQLPSVGAHKRAVFAPVVEMRHRENLILAPQL